MLEKEKRIRKNKSEKYEKERTEIIIKLNEIIGINDNKNNIILYDIDNEMVKNKIRKLVPEIRKYYRCSTWHYFKIEDRDEIGLMKSVYKNTYYELTNKRRLIERHGIKKQYIELHINKKLN